MEAEVLRFEGDVVSSLTVRPATLADADPILELVNRLAQEQLMLPRSPSKVLEGIREYVIAEDESGFLGCGALHVTWFDLAEIRSLAVVPNSRKGGVGRAIVDRLTSDAREIGVPMLFAFTYVPGFFEKLGFEVVQHGELPHKVFQDCLNCPKFMSCDEIAMAKQLCSRAETVEMAAQHPSLHSFPLPRKLARE